LILNKQRAVFEEYAKGRLSLAEARSQIQILAYQVKTQQEMLQNTQQIAKNTNCISERQRVAGNDYSGVGSTSGAVAIISLLGAMADGAAVASACS
jgi:predicted phage tail protein